MARIRGVIFDLDNVLFNERAYLLAAYRDIARFLSERSSVGAHHIYRRLAKASREKSSMYPRLFNDLLSDLRLEPQLLPTVLTIFANTQPALKLRATAEELLLFLQQQAVKRGLLTNGTVIVQAHKVQLLGLKKYFDAIVYARALGHEMEKPHPQAYLAVLTSLGLKPTEAVCIGDNPYTDFWGAKQLGILTVRLLQGEFRGVKLSVEYEADNTVRTLKEFLHLLEKMVGPESAESKQGSA